MSQEIYYYAGDGARITQDDVTSTAMTLQAQTQPDAKTLSDLTAEGAPLAAEALPDLQTVGADGSKGVWTAMGSTVSKARIKKREDTEQVVEVKPKTSQEILSCLCIFNMVAFKVSCFPLYTGYHMGKFFGVCKTQESKRHYEGTSR